MPFAELLLRNVLVIAMYDHVSIHVTMDVTRKFLCNPTVTVHEVSDFCTNNH